MRADIAITDYADSDLPTITRYDKSYVYLKWGDFRLNMHDRVQDLIAAVVAFKESEMSHDPSSPSDAADFEEDDNIAICEQCKDESIDPPALAETQVDDRWLCEYHAEREAQQTAEREADERYDDLEGRHSE